MSVDGQTDGLGEAIAQNGITILQSRPNRHGWQASPGLYRSLIVYPDAAKIFRRHRQVFEMLGYKVKPNLLTRVKALKNWESLKT